MTKKEGHIAGPHDPEGLVAEFSGYTYGKHRFEVSV